MTIQEIKQETIKELVANCSCDFCRKIGLYDKCKENPSISCDDYYQDFFGKLLGEAGGVTA